MTAIREAQIYNRLWKRLGVRIRSYVPLPPGSGACRTAVVYGTDEALVEYLVASTTGYEPRRSEA